MKIQKEVKNKHIHWQIEALERLLEKYNEEEYDHLSCPLCYADRRIIIDLKLDDGLNIDDEQMCKYCPWNWMKQDHCSYYLNYNELRKGSAYYKQSAVDKRVREIKRWIKALEKEIKP